MMNKLMLSGRGMAGAMSKVGLGSRSLVRSSALPLSTLSQQTIDIVKATAPVMAEHGYDITTTMYKKMLSENTSVKELFNPSHQVKLPNEVRARQPWSLACAVHAYAANIDNLGALSEAVARISEKHVSLYVLPEHYPIVGENLLWAVKEVLGDAATPEVITAWGEAYGFLADLLIEHERKLRETRANAEGGWEGWREFVVDRKEKESDEIYSFYLVPKDGKAIASFIPGQYTAIRVETPEFTTQRNYTLSGSPNRSYYRLTVKREQPIIDTAPPGRISNYLHDQVNKDDVLKLGVPCGDFILEVNHDKPIVLLSGGVGITPIVSMLENLVENKVKNNIIVVSTSRNPSVEAMHGLLAKYRRKHLNLVIKTLYDEGPSEYPKGPLQEEHLHQLLISKDAHYYFCGATGFMQNVYRILNKWNIPKDQIHFEFFGPHEDLVA